MEGHKMGFKSEQKNLTFSDFEKSFDKKNNNIDTLMYFYKAIS